MTEKTILRKKFANIRNSISDDARRYSSEKISDIILNMDKYFKSNSIFLYMSFGSEVETSQLAKRILSDGKILSVPLCDTKERTMCAVRITDTSMLTSGAYGIPEPRRELLDCGDASIIANDNIDIAIVPALAFDRNRMRLGYGGGYYDKFLRDFRGFSIGIAFSECITDALPADKFDCAVDRVICPEEMI